MIGFNLKKKTKTDGRKMTQVRETNLQGFEIIQVRHIGGHKEGYIRWIQVFFRLSS